MKDVDDYWKNIQPIDTHAKEYQMVNILNNHFIKTRFPYKADRIICDNVKNIYSEYDADIFEFDWNTLQKGKVVTKIDFERKPKDVFIGGCPTYWKSANFLYRKVVKETNANHDLYVLHDNHDTNPSVIWASYGIIRSIGYDNKNRNRENRFYEISKKQYEQLSYGYVSLMNYISNVKPERVWF